MSRPSSERSGMEWVTFVSEDAPEVSRGFVSRPDAAEALRSRIAGGVGPTPPVVVLYGPAGACKTTLVAAIADELARGTADRRSVLWLNLARSSDHLDGLMQAIGVIERHYGRPPARKDLPDPMEEMMRYTAEPRAFDTPDPSNDLRDWLSDWACLMVLDDVSLGEAARPLLVGAAGCPTLPATPPTLPWPRPLLVGAAGCPTVLIARDAKVADDLGVPALRLDAMDPKQCLALIEARVGTPLDPGERASALQLAEAVGRLPIVLGVLSAARSALDVSWSAVCEGVFAERSRARVPGENFAGESADRPIRLQAVVGWVLKRLPADLRESFAWLGVLRVGAQISPELAGRLWRVDGGTAITRLRRLAQVGLIDPVGSAGRATAKYRLHEAIRDEAWNLATAPVESASPDGLPGLGLSPSGAHSELLDRLRDGGPQVAWPTVAASLDLIDDLHWHMEQAGRPEDVDALLGEETPDGDNAWFLARELRSDRRGYLCDVVRAWRRRPAAARDPSRRSAVTR